VNPSDPCVVLCQVFERMRVALVATLAATVALSACAFLRKCPSAMVQCYPARALAAHASHRHLTASRPMGTAPRAAARARDVAMMAKNVRLSEKSRQKLVEGINIVANAVKVTLGPKVSGASHDWGALGGRGEGGGGRWIF
jgi:hypothetical protein